MFRLQSSAWTVMIIVSMTSTGIAEQRILQELVKAHAQNSSGEPLHLLGPRGEYAPKTIAELTREADVVFHGRVYRLNTYVGPDGEQVLSDYAIREQVLLAGRTPSAVARARDASKPLVLTIYGGEITIEGVRVIASPASQRQLVDGGEYILFLRPRKGDDRYAVYSAAVFEVQDGKVKPLHTRSETLFKDAVNAPLEAILARVQKARLQ